MYVLMSAVLTLSAHAATSPAFQKVIDRAPKKVTCGDAVKPFAAWTEHDGPIAPGPQVEAAMTALEKTPHPTPEDLEIIRAEMERDFATTFVAYNPVAASGCTQDRLLLARVVLRAAGRDAKLRATYAPRLAAIVRRPAYETLLDAMINAVILTNGTEEGLWSREGGVRDDILKLRKEMKVESVEFEKLYAKEFDAAGIGFQAGTPESVARLNALPNRDHIKAGLLREMTKAAEFFERERALADRLH